MNEIQITTLVIFFCTSALWVALYFIVIQPKQVEAKNQNDTLKQDFLNLYLEWLELKRRNKFKRPENAPPLRPLYVRFYSEYAEKVERDPDIQMSEKIKDLECQNQNITNHIKPERPQRPPSKPDIVL